jgi:hypothetical protein
MNHVLFLLREILKSANRIEEKLDELLMGLKLKQSIQTKPMHWKGDACPLCQRPVEYIPVLNGTEQDLIRKCGCEPQTDQIPVQPAKGI